MAEKKPKKMTIRSVEMLKKTRNEMHLNHRQNASGVGAHKNKKRYCRKEKHQSEYGED